MLYNLGVMQIHILLQYTNYKSFAYICVEELCTEISSENAIKSLKRTYTVNKGFLRSLLRCKYATQTKSLHCLGFILLFIFFLMHTSGEHMINVQTGFVRPGISISFRSRIIFVVFFSSETLFFGKIYTNTFRFEDCGFWK